MSLFLLYHTSKVENIQLLFWIFAEILHYIDLNIL